MHNDGHFDESVAATYDDDEARLDSKVVAPVADLLAELAGNGRVLEFAIGTGRIALPLAQRAVRVEGIELSRPMVERLRAKTGRDGFWLARWLRARGIEAHVIHAASVPVSREHRRAKTDRLDTEQLKRSFLGWLRGERDHCKMAAIPTFAEEDAKRPHRERETLVGEQTTIINRIKSTLARLGIRSFNPTLKEAPERLEHLRSPEGEPIPPNTLAELSRDLERKQLVAEQIHQIEKARMEQLKQAPKAGPNLMLLVLMRVIGIGIETADMLVKEILSRNLRDRRAVAR
jgi:transposase